MYRSEHRSTSNPFGRFINSTVAHKHTRQEYWIEEQTLDFFMDRQKKFDRLTDGQYPIRTNFSSHFWWHSIIAKVTIVPRTRDGCVVPNTAIGRTFERELAVSNLVPNTQNPKDSHSFPSSPSWQVIRAIPFYGSSCSSLSLGQWQEFALVYGSFSWYVHNLRSITFFWINH